MSQRWLWPAMLSLCVGCNPYPGKEREAWEKSNDGLRIRAQIYEEGRRSNIFDVFDRRCHLSLYSAPSGATTWTPLTKAYISPCDADIKGRVRFVGEHAAYVFIQWWLLVTVDGGHTWHDWDGAAKLPGRAYRHPNLIRDVSINPDGTGTMTLNAEGMADNTTATLHTDDFGLEWKTP